MTTPQPLPLPTDADRPDPKEIDALISHRDSEGRPEPAGEGLSVLDLASLPSAQLRVMRVLLRGVEMSYEALCTAIENLPQHEQLSRTELDTTLRVLVDERWLIRVEQSVPQRFKANLHRKSNRTISEFAPPRSSRRGSTLRNIWESLDKRDKG